MKKRLVSFSAIFLGILMCFNFNKVTAVGSPIDSVKSIRKMLTLTSLSSEPKIIGISKYRKSGNYYGWNQNTTEEVKNIWKLATYSSESSTEPDYSDLYYCLNASKGFGCIDGDMTEGVKDTYNVYYDMKDSEDKEEIDNVSEQVFKDNYNKIIWILDNVYIPTENGTYKTSAEYKKLMNNAGITINNDTTDLTEDDIDAIQQMAIWHITNSTHISDNNNLPSLYINGKQLTSVVEQGTYGQIKVGVKKQAKAEKLYNYFFNNATNEYSPVIPSLELSNTNAKVVEDGDYYIAGPFSLTGTNTNLIKEITPTINVSNYILLNSSKVAINNNDFNQVVNKDFYLKIPSRFITEDATVEISLDYSYDTRTLTFLTNEANTAQPLALIENEEVHKDPETEIDIEFTSVTVNKIWDDNNNQDGKRPQSIKIQLYADGVECGNPITLTSGEDGVWQNTELTYTWSKLLAGPTYTVKELKPNGIAIENNGLYNADYTVQYHEDDAFPSIQFSIENKHEISKKYIEVTKRWVDNDNRNTTRPEEITIILYADGEEVDRKTVQYPWTCRFEDLDVYKDGNMIQYTVDEEEVPGYTKRITNFPYIITNSIIEPDLALRKYITAINGEVIQSTDSNYRVPQYDTANLDDEDINTTTASYVHKKNAITVKTGDEIVYNITIYNEGEVNARASKITDQLPSGIEYEEILTDGYTATYDEETNRLIITKTEENNLPAYVKNSGTLSSETLQIKCKVTSEETNKNLTNIAWISEMKDENNLTFMSDIDSDVDDITTQYNKDNMSEYEGRENDNGYFKGQQDDDDFDRVIIEPEILNFDLSLRKFISEVKTVNGTTEKYSRQPQVDASKIGTLDGQGNTITTATYKHSKQPVSVQKGDIVTYTIRVYNEGEVDGYVNMITDHLPNNLLPIIEGVEGIDTEKYAEEMEFNSNWLWVAVDNNTVSTTITKKQASGEPEIYAELTGLTEVTDTKLNAHVEGSTDLDYIDVQIKCLVADSAVRGEYITNIAEIMTAQDINDVQGDGEDSALANANINNLKDYKNSEAINSNNESYIAGQEDDDDFEKLFVKEFDLSLRKFITKVNDKTYSREPVVDTSKLGTIANGKNITTATYIHTKDPVVVKTDDIVTYKIRIYNEGTISGFANEITDDIPEGLEFLPNSSKNVEYKWKMLDKDGNETDDVSKAIMIITDYLSDSNDNNIINAIRENDGTKVLDFKDVEVQFKVIAKAEKLKDNIIINEAQISSDSNNDIDSIPNRNEKYNYNTGKNEDDIDYEPIKLQYFDLALRKFITKVNTTDYNNRYPEVKFEEDGSIKYNHTKDPAIVETGDTVIYTIRVYNEGELAGTATEITDNIPGGLEFLPDNEINKEYNWKMLNENGEITEDITKAQSVISDSLKNEIIDAFVSQDGQKILAYKDIKIAFKVVQSNNVNKIIVNTAEISKDSNDDIDSTPNNKVETEDDLDKEYIKVEFFDLALKKWVTATKVTVDGKTTTTKTGFTEDSDKIAKVDIVSKKLNKTTVKFIYSIKVINEGEKAGYAYEVKDYIPNGLKFVKEDNPDWKEVKNDQVVTEKLKDTLLNPGESATVEIVLTWKNSATNLQLKTNYAEISSDSGNDIDSIPDNFNKKEDDIDDAQVILSLKTEGARTYIWLSFVTITILAGGIVLIKKYVINQ